MSQNIPQYHPSIVSPSPTHQNSSHHFVSNVTPSPEHFHAQADYPSFSSFSNQTKFHNEVDLSYPYKLKEPYFPTVLESNKHRNLVDITCDFSSNKADMSHNFNTLQLAFLKICHF
jgi:hypothetical protein